jgi:thiamine pyrophosphate-dependent acetolactate synthase large subunit-like protein
MIQGVKYKYITNTIVIQRDPDMDTKNNREDPNNSALPMRLSLTPTSLTIAEATLDWLKGNNLDYIFFNPDTSSVPFTDALAWKELTGDTPHPIMFLHEFPAVDAAYHYGLASLGKNVGVCMIGGVVGTLNAKGAIYNAWAGFGPCVVLAGMYQMKGTRYRGAHESVDQGGLVRENVKWETEPRTPKQVPHHIARAIREALTEPWGPVYLTCNERLFGGSGHLKGETVTPPLALPNFSALGPPDQIAASDTSVQAAAQLLLEAYMPIVVTGGMMGRYPETVYTLMTLAETMGLPVIPGSISAHGSKTMNFPTTHPMFLGYDLDAYLDQVDLVFVIDQPMVEVPPHVRSIFLDWGANFTPLDTPVDVRIHGCSHLVLTQITDTITQSLKTKVDAKKRVQNRFETLNIEHEQLIQTWETEAQAAKTKKPIDLIWLGYVLSKIKTRNTIICGRYGGNGYQFMKGLTFIDPGTRYGPSGGHMGYGIGGALGVKLALPDQPVISVMGDGSFYYGEAGAVFWTASHYNIPVLFIKLNDRSYGAITKGLARYNRWSYQHNYPAGVWIRQPEIRFEAIARANGLWATTATDPLTLEQTLHEAWQIVQEDKQPAFVDVICENRLP